MKKQIYLIFIISFLMFTSCVTDDTIIIETPATYTFTRNGETTVSFADQTTLIAMAEELVSALLVTTNTEDLLNDMFNHVEGINDFSSADLNSSDKSIRTNVAASVDYYYLNDTNATSIKEEFDDLITEHFTDVLPNYNITAVAGTAGVLTENDTNGGADRYFNSQGVEVDQFFTTALIGSLMVDQILNNYLSSSVLDEGDNVQDNDDTLLLEETNYTDMEHNWDQAYGYLYGAELDGSLPTYEADNFLNTYINEVDQDDDFTGIADDIYNAFKSGRAGIVAKDYDVREEQAEIIREKISQVIAVSALFYLEKGKSLLNETTIDYAAAFHNISKGLGFIYSLQFTRVAYTTSNPEPYFTKDEVDAYIVRLLDTGNGLWQTTTPDTIDAITADIDSEFEFTVTEETN